MRANWSRDGTPSLDLLRIGREQLDLYPTASFHQGRVDTAASEHGEFKVSLKSGDTFRANSLLLATGLVDILPEIEAFQNYYGRNVHQCPYCDAWERRNEGIGMLGGDQAALDIATDLAERQTMEFATSAGSDSVLSGKPREEHRLLVV